jgi:hypothetical protein
VRDQKRNGRDRQPASHYLSVFRSKFGDFAKFAVIRRASSLALPIIKTGANSVYFAGDAGHRPETCSHVVFNGATSPDRGRLSMPIDLHAQKASPERSWSAKARIDTDLVVTAQFCVIALLITFIVMLSFPDLGALIERYNQF